jgi:hypothetical protein
MPVEQRCAIERHSHLRTRRLSPALALGMFAPALWHYGCRWIVVIADAEAGHGMSDTEV